MGRQRLLAEYLPLLDRLEREEPQAGLSVFNSCNRNRTKLVELFRMIRDKKPLGAIIGSLHATGMVNMETERELHSRVRMFRGTRLTPSHETDFVTWAREMGDYYLKIITLFGQNKVDDAERAAQIYFEDEGSRMHYWAKNDIALRQAQQIEHDEFLYKAENSTH